MSDPAPRVLAVAAPGVPTDTASDTLRGIGFVVVAYFRPGHCPDPTRGRCPLDSRQGRSPLAGFRAAP